MPPIPQLLILCGDLMFATMLRSQAAAAGWRADVSYSLTDAVMTSLADYRAVIVDLELPGLDLAAFERSGAKRIAFGPHVQAQRLQAARDAGFDLVLTRGQISQSLPDVLRQLAAEA